VENLTAQKLEIGDALKFTCQVTGTPEAEIEWTKDGEKLQEGNFSVQCLDGLCSLMIPAVTLADSGTYRCKAVNSAGSVTTTGKLEVAAKTPVFATFPKSLTLEEGCPAVFSCSFKGDNNIKVRWTRNGHDLMASDRLKLYDLTKDHLLEISTCLSTDAGMYTVYGESPNGRCSASFTLDVDVDEGTERLDVKNSWKHYRQIDHWLLL